MHIPFATYALLFGAVVCEAFGASFLEKSGGMTRILPFCIALCCYFASFAIGSRVLGVMPMGIMYALWTGMGVVMVSLIGAVFNRQMLDTPAILGIALIVAGVCVIHRYSQSTVS